MNTKAKRSISTQINQILKENGFYRVGGGWNSTTLHIGVQPQKFQSTAFDDDVANLNFKKCIRQIKKISSVVKAASSSYFYGWHSFAGIKIDLK